MPNLAIYVMDHELSRDYTTSLIKGLTATVYDSSKFGTRFTESFNRCLMDNPRADYVMVCNNDIRLTDSQVEQAMRYIDGRDGIFHIACNSPHIKVMTAQGSEPLREVPWVEFVAPIISRKVIDAIGGLDSDMSYGWGVELDYCYRAKKAGYSSFLAQRVDMCHYGHKSQESHQEYIQKASPEMHRVLEKKYGTDWKNKLSYPQW